MEQLTGGPIPAAAYGPVVRQFFGLDQAQTERVLREYPLSRYDGSTGASLSPQQRRLGDAMIDLATDHRCGFWASL